MFTLQIPFEELKTPSQIVTKLIKGEKPKIWPGFRGEYKNLIENLLSLKDKDRIRIDEVTSFFFDDTIEKDFKENAHKYLDINMYETRV